MSKANRFCIDWMLGTFCTFLLGLTIMLCITMGAWKADLQPFSIALGPMELMKYQTGGVTLFALEFGNHFILLSAIGGLLYGLWRASYRVASRPVQPDAS